MVKRFPMFAVVLLAASTLFAFDEPIRRTLIVRDGNVIFDNDGLAGKRAYVGISLTELTPELREFFGAPKEAGVLVSSVAENRPAAKAGVRVGDVITSVNGKATANYRDFRDAIKDSKAGDSVRLDVIRGKSRQTFTAAAEEREMPEFGALRLGEMGRAMPDLPKGLWRGRLIEPGENEDLRKQIHDLEKRLQELEKRLQK